MFHSCCGGKFSDSMNERQGLLIRGSNRPIEPDALGTSRHFKSPIRPPLSRSHLKKVLRFIGRGGTETVRTRLIPHNEKFSHPGGYHTTPDRLPG